MISVKSATASLLLVLGVFINGSALSEGEQIVLDNRLSRETLTPWLAYAGARVTIRKELKIDRHTFEEESKAREVCADVWEEFRVSGASADIKYLDELLAVRKAGFIREYTRVYFQHSDWPVPDDLRLEEFADWNKQNLDSHVPQTRADIK